MCEISKSNLDIPSPVLTLFFPSETEKEQTAPLIGVHIANTGLTFHPTSLIFFHLVRRQETTASAAKNCQQSAAAQTGPPDNAVAGSPARAVAGTPAFAA